MFHFTFTLSTAFLTAVLLDTHLHFFVSAAPVPVDKYQTGLYTNAVPLSPVTDHGRLVRYASMGLNQATVPRTQPISQVHPDAAPFIRINSAEAANHMLSNNAIANGNSNFNANANGNPSSTDQTKTAASPPNNVSGMTVSSAAHDQSSASAPAPPPAMMQAQMQAQTEAQAPAPVLGQAAALDSGNGLINTGANAAEMNQNTDADSMQAPAGAPSMKSEQGAMVSSTSGSGSMESDMTAQNAGQRQHSGSQQEGSAPRELVLEPATGPGTGGLPMNLRMRSGMFVVGLVPYGERGNDTDGEACDSWSGCVDECTRGGFGRLPTLRNCPALPTAAETTSRGAVSSMLITNPSSQSTEMRSSAGVSVSTTHSHLHSHTRRTPTMSLQKSAQPTVQAVGSLISLPIFDDV